MYLGSGTPPKRPSRISEVTTLAPSVGIDQSGGKGIDGLGTAGTMETSLRTLPTATAPLPPPPVIVMVGLTIGPDEAVPRLTILTWVTPITAVAAGATAAAAAKRYCGHAGIAGALMVTTMLETLVPVRTAEAVAPKPEPPPAPDR